jgi:hypothetical protein
MANAVTSKTFYNRYHKCYFYNESHTYIKYIDILFNKLLDEFATSTKSFLNIFASQFTKAVNSGVKFIYKADRAQYSDMCINYATNIDKFFKKFNLININDEVVYKDKIRCYINGKIKDKNINVYFCFRKLQEMQKDLDFYLVNNYIYNQIKGLKNDCLIFNVQSDVYYLIKAKDADYTTLMRKGFIKSIISSRIKRQGEHCLLCKEQCKPMLINKLDRLVSTI